MHAVGIRVILDPIRTAVAPYALLIKAGVVLALAATLFIGGCNHGAGKWKGKYDDEVRAHEADEIDNEALLDALDKRAKAAEAAAKEASAQAARDRKAADDQFNKAKQESDHEIAGLRRALRTGTVRLRPEFACPAARPAEGEPGTAAGGQDGEAELRRTREGAILDAIGDADHSDSWIYWLQSELISTRKACGL